MKVIRKAEGLFIGHPYRPHEGGLGSMNAKLWEASFLRDRGHDSANVELCPCDLSRTCRNPPRMQRVKFSSVALASLKTYPGCLVSTLLK